MIIKHKKLLACVAAFSLILSNLPVITFADVNDSSSLPPSPDISSISSSVDDEGGSSSSTLEEFPEINLDNEGNSSSQDNAPPAELDSDKSSVSSSKADNAGNLDEDLNKGDGDNSSLSAASTPPAQEPEDESSATSSSEGNEGDSSSSIPSPPATNHPSSSEGQLENEGSSSSIPLPPLPDDSESSESSEAELTPVLSMLFSNRAIAINYPILVGEEQVTSDNIGTLISGASFDLDTNTLTLDNINLSIDSDSAALTITDRIEVVVRGTNDITNSGTGHGIEATGGSITMSGSGTLNVTAGSGVGDSTPASAIRASVNSIDGNIKIEATASNGHGIEGSLSNIDDGAEIVATTSSNNINHHGISGAISNVICADIVATAQSGAGISGDISSVDGGTIEATGDINGIDGSVAFIDGGVITAIARSAGSNSNHGYAIRGTVGNIKNCIINANGVKGAVLGQAYNLLDTPVDWSIIGDSKNISLEEVTSVKNLKLEHNEFLDACEVAPPEPPLDYTITYIDEDGETALDLTPKTYTGEVEVTLPTPTKEGYNFLGWTTTNNSTDTTYISKIAEGEIGDKTFYANWQKDPNAWTKVTFIDGNGVHFATGTKEVWEVLKGTDWSEISVPIVNIDSGYENSTWSPVLLYNGDKLTEPEYIFTASATIKSFDITYWDEETGEEIAPSLTPDSYDIEDGDVTLPPLPPKPGFIPEGWIDKDHPEGGHVTTIPEGSTGDKNFEADYEKDPKQWSVVNFVVGEGVSFNADDVLVQEELIGTVWTAIEVPTVNLVDGYESPKWAPELLNDTDTLQNTSYTFEVSATPIEYTIKYFEEEDNTKEITPTLTPDGYNVTEKVTLPSVEEMEDLKPGYDFKGWLDKADPTGGYVTEIPRGTIGNKEFIADYEKDLNAWTTVTFIAGDGVSFDGVTAGEDVVLEVLRGSMWADVITVPTVVVADSYISPHAWDDHFATHLTEQSYTYTASALPYVDNAIVYMDEDGVTRFDGLDPDTYNIASQEYLPDATEMEALNPGYTFLGWTDTNEAVDEDYQTQTPLTDVGTKFYYANWQEDPDYWTTVTFYEGDGVSFNSYDVKVQKVPRNSAWSVISVPTTNLELGYVTPVWDVELFPSTLTEPSYTFTASATPVKYTITYFDEDEVTKIDGLTPNEYTITSPDLALPDASVPLLTKPGYTFEGWLDKSDLDGGLVTKIPAGSTGNREFVAVYKKDPNQWTKVTFIQGIGVEFDKDASTPTATTQEVLRNSVWSNITVPVVSLKSGYENNIWKDLLPTDDATQLTEPSYVFTASATPIKYTITYWDTETSEKFEDLKPDSFNVNTGTITLPTKDKMEELKPGYDFEGWIDRDNPSGGYVTSIPEDTTENKEFDGIFTKNPDKWTTVEFVAGEGVTFNVDAVLSQEVLRDSAWGAITVPTVNVAANYDSHNWDKTFPGTLLEPYYIFTATAIIDNTPDPDPDPDPDPTPPAPEPGSSSTPASSVAPPPPAPPVTPPPAPTPTPEPTPDPEDDTSSAPEPAPDDNSSSTPEPTPVLPDDNDDNDGPTVEITPEGDVDIDTNRPDQPDDVIVNEESLDEGEFDFDDGVITIAPGVFEDGENEVEIVYGDETINTVIISEDGVPRSAFVVPAGAWSLFDLMMTVATFLITIFYALKKREIEEDEEDEQKTDDQKEAQRKRKVTLTISSAILFLISLILLLWTQDFTLPMGIFDKYSIWFAAITIIDILLTFIYKQKEEDDEDNEQANPA